MRNRRVSATEKSAFLGDPASWLTGHVFTDIDAEFCPRVTGVGIWRARYFGAASESEIDWFDKKPKAERSEAEREDRVRDDPSEYAAGESTPEDPPSKSGPVVLVIEDNDEQITFGRERLSLLDGQQEAATVDIARYSRVPLPHQVEAIGWLLAHAQRISPSFTSAQNIDPGGGVLLADDMGLGKTFSTLVFLGEWMRRMRAGGSEPSPQILRQVDLPNPPPDIIQLLDEPKNRRIDLRFTLRGSEEVRRELQKEVDDLQSLQRSLRKTLDTQ